MAEPKEQEADRRTFSDIKRDVDEWLAKLEGEAYEAFRGALVDVFLKQGYGEGKAEQVVDDLVKNARRARQSTT